MLRLGLLPVIRARNQILSFSVAVLKKSNIASFFKLVLLLLSSALINVANSFIGYLSCLGLRILFITIVCGHFFGLNADFIEIFGECRRLSMSDIDFFCGTATDSL
ncbi:hypothetical protein D3C73_936330 [compost metagenome]